MAMTLIVLAATMGEYAFVDATHRRAAHRNG